MSSGHKSGLQTAGDFAHAEKKLRRRQREELAKHTKGHTGGETIERHHVAPRQHNALLFGLLDELVPGGDLRARGVEAIAYGSGPGSFTGLRIAASAAQGLAFSSCLPAVAVPTLATLAQTSLRLGLVTEKDRVLCTLDARANEVYSAVFSFRGGLAVQQEGPTACAPAELTLAGGDSVLALGSGCRYLEEFSPVVRQLVGNVVPDILPCAGDMIPLARDLFERGETQVPADIQPVYVRDEINWKKVAEQGKRQ